MAHPAQVANDLQAQHDLINKRGYNEASMRRSLIRGRDTIRELVDALQSRDAIIEKMEEEQLKNLKVIAELEAAAEHEAQRYERFANGDDLHG